MRGNSNLIIVAIVILLILGGQLLRLHLRATFVRSCIEQRADIGVCTRLGWKLFP